MIVILFLSFFSMAAETVDSITKDQAVNMAKKCLASTIRPVTDKESVSAEIREKEGKEYWLVKVQIEPPMPEGARFLEIYSPSDIQYVAFHKNIKYKYVNGKCHEL